MNYNQFSSPFFYGSISLFLLAFTFSINAGTTTPPAKSKDELTALIKKYPECASLQLDMAAVYAEARDVPQTIEHLSEAVTNGATMRQLILCREVGRLLQWETQNKGTGGPFEVFLNESFGSECATRMREEDADRDGSFVVLSVTVEGAEKTPLARKLSEAKEKMRSLVLKVSLNMLKSERTALWARQDQWEEDLQRRFSHPQQIEQMEQRSAELQETLNLEILKKLGRK